MEGEKIVKVRKTVPGFEWTPLCWRIQGEASCHRQVAAKQNGK